MILSCSFLLVTLITVPLHSIPKMCTHTHIKSFSPFIGIYLLSLFYIPSLAVKNFSSINNVIVELEQQDTNPCVPCSNRECIWTPKVIQSPMLIYHNDFKEFDLGVSINPPTEKNEWCYFEVYWESELQTRITINENGSIISAGSTWRLEHMWSDKPTTFYLVRDAPGYDFPNSGNLLK